MSAASETILDILRERGAEFPDKRILTFLRNGEIIEDQWTYKNLFQHIQQVSTSLQLQSTEGSRVLILLPQGLSYVGALFGCFYSKVIAVPVYPPKRNRADLRIKSIFKDCKPDVIISTSKIRESAQKHNHYLNGAKWIDYSEVMSVKNNFEPKQIMPDDIALLQYTSGSTGSPKGVMVTHNNIIENSKILKEAFKLSTKDVAVSWLPLFHDMGLIEGLIQPIFSNFPLILMSPLDFIQKPFRWLKAMSDFKGTHAGSPNFGYDLCCEKISEDSIEVLDLSQVNTFYNGAETVKNYTLERFTQKFQKAGLKKTAMFPCYGMAEATLMITGSEVSEQAKSIQTDKKGLSQHKIILTQEDRNSVKLVSCGTTKRDVVVKIVDPKTKMQSMNGEIGEIWIKGKTVARGYWQNRKATMETFNQVIADSGEGGFLRSGDLGYIHENELYITGRLKDLIIIRGQNYYPSDIETIAVKAHPSLELGGTIAFGIDTIEGEKLVIVQELKRVFRDTSETKEIIFKIRNAITSQFEISPSAIILVKTKSILKTSSGKLRRMDTKKQYLDNELSVIDYWELSD